MNLIERRIKVKGNEPVTIVPIGDMHVGNIGFDKKYFQDMVDWICEEKNCYTIGMGDFADSIIHLDADRYDVNCVDTEFNTIEKQYRYVSKWLGKLAKKDKLLAILTGNHEYTIEHKYGHEICNRLSYDLGIKNLGVQGMIRLVLQENYDTKKNKSHAYTIFCHHGCGAGRKTGSVVNRIEEFAEAYDADLFAMGHCLSSDTEILSEDGWKDFNNISRNDNIMSFNIKNKKLELNKVNDLFIDLESKEHVNFKTNTLHVKVTPDHDMVYKTMTSKGTILKKKAKDLMGSTFKIMQAGNFSYPGTDISDDMLRLYGWIISEGGFAGRDEGLTIAQNIDNAYKIRNILRKLNIKFSEYLRDTVGRVSIFPDGKEYATKLKYIVFYVHKKDAHAIREHFECEKLIPSDLVNEMTRDQFLCMLETMIDGDGHKASNSSSVYYTGDENLADQIQIACITRGIRCIKKMRNRGGNNNYELYINTRFTDVSVTPYPHRGNIFKSNVENGDFSWCVSVDNSNIVCRRNGCVFITGNTHRKFGSIQARWKISDQKDGDGNLTLREHKVAFINTGTFLNTFVVGGPSTYAERAGYNPTVKGVMKAILSLDGDIHVRE